MNIADDVAGIAQARKPSLIDASEITSHFDGKEVMVATDSKSSTDARESNGPTPDGEEPNAEELATLRRVTGKIPWLAYTVAFVEMCERFSYYGTTNIFTNFIQQPRPSSTGALYKNHEGPNHGGHKASGALNQGQQTATGLTTFNQFWSYVMPLLGGWVADAYLGRYVTIQWAILWAVVGHLLIIIAALPPVLDSANGAMASFVLGLIIMGVGTGGFKSNVSPLIAEQVKDRTRRIKTLKSGERVIVDPVVTISRIFLYFYFMVNVGSCVGSIAMVYAENYVGFWLAYLLPTAIYLLAPIVLILCKKNYVLSPPTGSVLAKSFQLLTFAVKKRASWNPVRTYKNVKAPGFWDDVKPSRLGDNRPKWMVFDDAWVDQVQRGFSACRVFFWYPLYWLAYNQMVSNMTSQSATLAHPGVPSDLIQNFNPISLLIFIPIVDILVYPALRKMRIAFTPLKRITAGFGVASAAMICTTVIQYYIYKTGPCGSYMNDCDDTSPISVFVQILAYVLIAFSEIFASITGLEYAFTKAPENMRSLVTGLFLLQSAFGAALQQAFVALSEDPLLEWNYGVAAVLAAVGCVGFWWSFRKLDRDEERLNYLTETEFKGKMKPYGDHDGVAPMGDTHALDVDEKSRS
ncbi:MAG: hypothetical protein Q9162_002872 [Coniocarpon cinnabarinum]